MRVAKKHITPPVYGGGGVAPMGGGGGGGGGPGPTATIQNGTTCGPNIIISV